MRRGVVAAVMAAVAAGALFATAGLQTPAGTSPRVDRERLLTDLRVLSADDMEGRLAGTAGGARARAYVVKRFGESGIEPFGSSHEQPFTFVAGRGGAQSERTGVNVVGRVPGSTQRPHAIVISAHYDHVGVRDGVVFNGADDNASGTAALFALGRYFASRAPAHTLIFAAFDAEEGGLRGARAFVADPPVALPDIALNLNLDMIARDAEDTLYAAGTYHYPFLKPLLEPVASAAPITLVFGHDDPTKAGVEDWTRSSDHAPFHQEKIPFIYFGVEDFAQHHKATDDYETITHDFYVRVVETLIDAVRAFDANLEAIARERGRIAS
jgi:Zn-dependent M28 family amino/carboxypeptidase